jgi:hypothetical protein
MDNWLNTANAWITYLLAVLILVGAVEGGAWLAHRHRTRDPDKDADRFLSILAAPSIGLLALMIGFTFSMSLSRFDARRTAVLNEANAIGTAALRGSMLAEPYSTAVGPLFKEYAQLRVAHRGAALSSQQNAERLRRSTELQDSLWQQASRAAKSNPSVVPTGLFIQALDAMLDAHEARLTADRNNVPAVVFLMLEGIAVLALGFCGYGVVQARMHHRIPMVLMALMIGGVITLVMDLDRPQSGLIIVSQQPLLDLIKGLP